MNYFELDYVGVDQGRGVLRDVSSKKSFAYPSYKPVLDRRWRALVTKWNESDDIKQELANILKIIMAICADRTMVSEQREIYYAVRGRYPNLEVDGEKWEHLYDTFLGNYINKVQLAVGIPMQSFGVEAGSRGSVAGEGFLTLEKGTRVPLNAEPKLRFELVREGVRYQGHARKHVHYEKEAGFAKLTGGDIAQFVEAIFSCSQGYASEAASKFLRDSEERGIKTYSLHDADPHGLQMQMMYNVASKSNCYMTSRFYPENVTYLGLVPRVASAIGLPHEKIDESHRRIIPNLRKLLQEEGEFVEDIEIFENQNAKWEFQALDALSEQSPQIYLVESLRARGDEIKYVPDASELKDGIAERIKDEVAGFVEAQTERYVDNFYEENIKPVLLEQLKNKLEPDINAFNDMMLQELPKLDAMSDQDIREAVKLKLVKNPAQFQDVAQNQVMRDMLEETFNITSSIDWDTEVVEASAEKTLVVSDPITPDEPLTKTDIVDAIQRRVVTQKPARDKAVLPIRKALEEVFGEPDEQW